MAGRLSKLITAERAIDQPASPLFRFGMATLAVVLAALLVTRVHAIQHWGRGALVLFYFAIGQVAFWQGFYPCLFATFLSILGLNALILVPVWEGNLKDALVLNAGFCLVSAVSLLLTYRYQQQAKMLQESRQDLKLAQAIGKIGSWRLNLQRNELVWSEESYRIFGVPNDLPLTYEFFLSKVHPDEQEFVNLRWQMALSGKCQYDLEHRIVVNGEIKWVHEKAVLEFDSKGNLLGGFGTAQDISAEKQSQQALQEVLGRYELVLNGAQDGIWDWDITNNRTHYSSRWKTLHGYAADEELQGVSEWRESIHPDDEGRVMAEMQLHLDGVTPVFNEEYRIQCKDGSWKWVLDRGIAQRDLCGRAIRMVGSEKDITDRKKAEAELRKREQQLQAIIDTAPALISYIDSNYRYLRVNKAYEKCMGLNNEEIIGRHPLEVIGPRAWELVKDHLEAARSGREVSFDMRIPFGHEKMRWVHVTYSPHKDAGNRLIGIVVHVVDIEERIAVEKALQESRDRVEVATQAANAGVWEWNVLENSLHWDAQMFKIYGLTPTDDGIIDYSAWRNTVIPEDMPRIGAYVKEAMQTKTSCSTEFRIRHSGETALRTIKTSFTTRLNAEGDVEWLLGTDQDITQQVNAENDLREREKQLQLVMNLTPALISYLSPDFRYLRVNRVYEDWFGLSSDKILGQTVENIVGEKTWIIVRPFLERAFKGEQVQYDTKVWTRKDLLRWVSVTHVPDIDADGVVKGVVVHVSDIDERKKAAQEIAKLNQALQHRVEEMQTIFDTAPIGLAISDDIVGKQIRANRALVQILGLPHGEFYLQPAMQGYKILENGKLLDSDDMTFVRALRGKTDINRILEIQRVDGQKINVLASAVPLFGDHGLVRGAVGALLDITALSKAESALRISEERLRLAQSAGGMGIYDYNLVSREVQCDLRLLEIWGLKIGQTLTISNFLDCLHPDDIKGTRAGMKAVLNPQQGGEYHAEYRIVRPADKAVVWVAVFGIVSFANGKAVRMVGFVQDISERKQAEAKLRETELRLTLALEEINAGFWDWDIKSNRVYFSPEWKHQLGYTDDELLNEYAEWESRLHPEDLDYTLQMVEEHKQGRMPNFEVEFRLRHKDGSYRWIHSRAKALRGENNLPYRMFGIHLDITDFKSAREMSQRRERMEGAFRMNVASQTVAAIAHELNQPLTAISYLADASVAMAQTSGENKQKLISTLQRCSGQALRAGRIIRELMVVLQKSELITEPVDINELVYLAYEHIKDNAALGAINVVFQLAPDLPKVCANGLQIQKTLIVLLDNSLEAMQEAGNLTGVITVTTARDHNDPKMVLIKISDQGEGVPDPGTLNKMFQPFYSTKNQGLGMGLAISRSLVEAYGGKIWAEQNDDIGITIFFTLPLAP